MSKNQNHRTLKLNRAFKKHPSPILAMVMALLYILLQLVQLNLRIIDIIQPNILYSLVKGQLLKEEESDFLVNFARLVAEAVKLNAALNSTACNRHANR